MQILGATWFSNQGGTVGIVRVSTDYEGIKYYIAAVDGLDEQEDKQFVADWGSTFPNAVGDILFGVDPVKNGDAVPVPLNKEHAEAMVRVGAFYLEHVK